MPIQSSVLRGVDLLRSADLALCGFVAFLRFVILRREVDRPPREEPAYLFAEFLWLSPARTVIVRRIASDDGADQRDFCQAFDRERHCGARGLADPPREPGE